jgi:hypothetical protein
MAPDDGFTVKRTWWILPYFGGLLAVLAVATVVTVAHHAAGKPRPARSPAATTAAAPMPAMMFPDALFRELTKDIQAGDEARFLAMVAPRARAAVQTWWENLRDIGFTTGAIIPTASHDMVRIDRHGDGTAVVLAGAHSPLDPLYGGKPDIPAERYRIGIHFASPAATGQITSWQPLGGAPWDTGLRLTVRKTAHVVVAGLPGDGALVEETLPLAEAAASYDIGLMNQVNPNDLRQEGFVVFVSHAGTGGWFGTTAQPRGWPPVFHGGRLFLLPGPAASTEYASAPGNLAAATTGGARVVITPYQQAGGTAHLETLTLIREFMLDILAAHDEELAPGTPLLPVPSWALEGFGTAVEALYLQTTNPAPAAYRFDPLTAELRKLPPAYRKGKLPATRQLFTGPATQPWHDVAASVYEYIGMKYGMNQMLGSAVLMYTRFPAPFGNVLKPGRAHGNFTFYSSPAVQAGWRSWLAGL